VVIQVAWVFVLQVLVEHGAHVDARDWRGYSPAHLAISHGHSLTLRALINAGAVTVASLHTLRTGTGNWVKKVLVSLCLLMPSVSFHWRLQWIQWMITVAWRSHTLQFTAVTSTKQK